MRALSPPADQRPSPHLADRWPTSRSSTSEPGRPAPSPCRCSSGAEQPSCKQADQAVKDAIAATITTLPAQLRRSLTWDRGKEMAQHTHLKIDTGLQVYFADPHSPWQRGTNENCLASRRTQPCAPGGWRLRS